VAPYALSKSIEILWLEDGDHDFNPRKSVSIFFNDRSSADVRRNSLGLRHQDREITE
jgi:predicted alpha/beta-hydrolase family hydrolase